MINKIGKFEGPYFFLSNFYPAPFVDETGTKWKSSEHYYQAQKTSDPIMINRIKTATAGKAKRLGAVCDIRPDWESIKVDVMKRALRWKFAQNPDLKDLLLKTVGTHLEEGNTWGDKIWGTVNGEGQNLLGKLLMEIREEFFLIKAREVLRNE